MPPITSPDTCLKQTSNSFLSQIKSEPGTRQGTVATLSFAPSWILGTDLYSEVKNKRTGAYIEILTHTLPQRAKLISSHYRIMENDDYTLWIKERLVLHGNRDKEKYIVRRDSAPADLAIVRIVVALAQILNFTLATANVKGAYMESGPILRNIFAKPRKKLCPRHSLWKLLRLPYSMMEAGRQWFCAVEHLRVNQYRIRRVEAID